MGRTTLLLALATLLAAACTGQAVDDVAIFEDLARRPDLSAAGYDLAVAPNADLAVSSNGDLKMTSDMARTGDLATDPTSCVPSGGCQAGPPCGNGCCGAGEACDPNTHLCKCGGGPPCGAKMMCASGQFRMDRCGSVCCGNGVPCPP